MKLVERFWTAVTTIFGSLTLSPFGEGGVRPQRPLPVSDAPFVPSSVSLSPAVASLPPAYPHFKVKANASDLVFKPRPYDDKDNFTCVYPGLGDEWEPCNEGYISNGHLSRECWIRKKDGSERFDIHTDYERWVPQGIVRPYNLTIRDSYFDGDGLNFTDAKLFNNIYPGPFIRGCIGDTLHVNVTNEMKWNGTTVHWHGVRQNQTVHMDGVPGVTQCPIAPGDHFMYKFQVVQYGSSWYHSHYSLQYADGALGPLSFYGPSSDYYDESRTPTIMTDWAHNSAFQAIHSGPVYPSILLNAYGDVSRFSGIPNQTYVRPPYEVIVDRNYRPAMPGVGAQPKRYLLRLINTSFSTTFVFSIDNHNLTVVAADFVPIKPYNTTNVLVGIGQRYNVIVTARPVAYGNDYIPDNNEFWMRTFVAEGCSGRYGHPGTLGYEKTGVLRYNNTYGQPPSGNLVLPTTEPWSNIDTTCSDEPFDKLIPMVKRTAKAPSNGALGQALHLKADFDAEAKWSKNPMDAGFPFAVWSLVPDPQFQPMRIDYNNPTFLNLEKKGDWPDPWAVVPAEFDETEWVYLVLIGKQGTKVGAHPMHLHGHDFLMLQQATNTSFETGGINLKLDNPPRRDQVLLPADGFIVIAFQADNPGPWIMHCHIAMHASEGLGMQVLENQHAAAKKWPAGDPAIVEAGRVCQNWNKFQSDCMKWWPGDGKYCGKKFKEYIFHDDSGV